MGDPVVHFEVIGEDAAKLQDFYAKVFSWTIHAENPMNYGLVHTEAGRGIDGGVGAGDPGRGVTFYIEVADPQATLERIEDLGGKTVMPITELPGMVTMAQFVDPEGNRVGLVKSED